MQTPEQILKKFGIMYNLIRAAQREAWLAGREASAISAEDTKNTSWSHPIAKRIRELPMPKELE